MIRIGFVTLLMILADVAIADTVVAARTIRASTILAATDIAVQQTAHPNGFLDPQDVIGQEARVTLYAGRPILLDEIGPPAIVDRNQIVAIIFVSGGLVISTEGRSLQRGSAGDYVRLMNLTSRATLFGQVQSDGTVLVSNRKQK